MPFRWGKQSPFIRVHFETYLLEANGLVRVPVSFFTIGRTATTLSY